MYSGYSVMRPLVSAFWISSVEPMFSLYETLKPFASSACLYSWPRTKASPKFFVPTMIGVCVASLLAPAVVAPPRMIATPKEIANAAFAARRVCLRIIETSDRSFDPVRADPTYRPPPHRTPGRASRRRGGGREGAGA